MSFRSKLEVIGTQRLGASSAGYVRGFEGETAARVASATVSESSDHINLAAFVYAHGHEIAVLRRVIQAKLGIPPGNAYLTAATIDLARTRFQIQSIVSTS